jgi:hypothetical protein
MQPSKAIIVGSTIIGACVLTQLGYTISHDRAVAEAARRAQEQQAKAIAETYKRVQSKEALLAIIANSRRQVAATGH